jgi:hypothetical protein
MKGCLTLVSCVAVMAAAGALIWRVLDPAGVARFDAKAAAQIERATAAQRALKPAQLESWACDAVKQAILADMRAPASSTFGPCYADDSDNPGEYTVGVAINVPHTDEHGTHKPDTFYYGRAKLDPATHEMRVEAGDLVHN